MRNITLILLVCIVSIATGCPVKLIKTRPSTKFSQNQLSKQINDYLANRQLAYYCSLNNKQVGFNYTTIEYSCGNGDVEPVVGQAMAKRIRNEAIENGIMGVNSVYAEFVDDLNTGRATSNFVADVVDLGLGAAIGISKGERPLQILGVALTAFRGGRRSVDVNFFKEQTMPILINKMDDNRSIVYASILLKKSRSAEDYPMAEAIRDIVDYYNAGTLVRALTQLSKDTGEKANQSEKRVLQLKRADPETIVNIPPEVIPFGDIFFSYRDKANSIFAGTDQAAKDDARNKLLLTYIDISKDPDLKPRLDALAAANPTYASDMAKLAAGDVTVDGARTLFILRRLFMTFDDSADAKLMKAFAEHFSKHPLAGQ